MKCPNCGAEIEEGKTICNYCQKSNNVVHEEPVSAYNDDGKRHKREISSKFFYVYPIIIGAGALIWFLLSKDKNPHAIIPFIMIEVCVVISLLLTGKIIERYNKKVREREERK